jgi:hypothetical protein
VRVDLVHHGHDLRVQESLEGSNLLENFD